MRGQRPANRAWQFSGGEDNRATLRVLAQEAPIEQAVLESVRWGGGGGRGQGGG